METAEAVVMPGREVVSQKRPRDKAVKTLKSRPTPREDGAVSKLSHWSVTNYWSRHTLFFGAVLTETQARNLWRGKALRR